MKKYFITFAGGNRMKFYPPATRLIHQAKLTKLFDEYIFHNDMHLKHDPNFWGKHGNFINKNPRGYGYWLWKPYIIKSIMDRAVDGDIILYLDAGCEILHRKRNILLQYFEYIKTDLLICCETTNVQLERKYNKMDLIKELDMADNQTSLSTRQKQAGAILLLVCPKTREFVNKWYELACNYHFIDDSPSIEKNYPDFIEHRHDQSVFSLLVKKYGFNSSHSIMTAIEYVRNKTGRSIMR